MGNAKLKVGAFTLIELLVVIGVIAILAGIVLGVLPAAQSQSVRKRVKADLSALELAIDSYKAKNNFYPPGNNKEGFPNSLFYELTGTTHEAVPPPTGPLQYKSNFSPSDPALKAVELKQLFNVEGFLNTAPTAEQRDVPNFYKNLLPRQVREMDTNNGALKFKMLAAARRGMDMQPAVWQYNAGSPTNNVGEFDLWAEIELRGERVIIGNWEK